MSSKPTSDFSDLLQSRKARKNPVEVGTELQNQVDETPSKKIGRPKGRRSNPDCISLTLLVNERILVKARNKLNEINIGKTPKKTMSDVIDTLLEEWGNE